MASEAIARHRAARFAICGFCFLFLLAARAIPASWQSAEELAAWSEERMARCDKWMADFTQGGHMLPMSVVARGQMMGRMPNQFRMESVVPMFGKQAIWLVVAGADGVVWQELNMEGRVQVIKGRVGGMNGALPMQDLPLTPQALWKMLRVNYTLKLGPTMDHEGERLVVLEAIPRDNAEQATGEVQEVIATSPVRLFISATDGWPRRVELLDARREQTLLWCELKNLRFDESLPDELFRYTPPAGASVVELKPPPRLAPSP
ncbi:MAG: hypothetical protein RMM51_02570 [Verrucomicrobiae bacterium]|nr:hypothetical protein [Verrucomicrobiae bacterium]